MDLAAISGAGLACLVLIVDLGSRIYREQGTSGLWVTIVMISIVIVFSTTLVLWLTVSIWIAIDYFVLGRAV